MNFSNSETIHFTETGPKSYTDEVKKQGKYIEINKDTNFDLKLTFLRDAIINIAIT